MIKLKEYIYNFIVGTDQIKAWISSDNILIFYYEYIYQSKKEDVFCYINLNKIVFSFITFIIFFFFFWFDICIFSENVLKIIKFLISILFFFNLIKLLKLIIIGFYEKYYKYDEEKLDNALVIIFKYLNFLINVSLLYYIFDLNINTLLQYNILFIFNFLYNIFFFFNSKIKMIELKKKYIFNFTSYPFFCIFLILIFLFINTNVSYFLCVYFLDYIYIFDKKISFDLKKNQKFKTFLNELSFL